MQNKRSALGRRLAVIAATAALAVVAVGAPPAAAAPATDSTTNVATSVLALTLGTTVPAVPAAAKADFGVNFVLSGDCDSGGNRMLCWIQNPGRPEPYIIRWYLNGVHHTYYDGEGAINFYCKYVYSVRVELIDAVGERAELWGNCLCNPGPWP